MNMDLKDMKKEVDELDRFDKWWNALNPIQKRWVNYYCRDIVEHYGELGMNGPPSDGDD